jgi:hypothetical protein
MNTSRVHQHTPGRPLSLAQKRVLVALVRSCPDLGNEADVDAVAHVSGVKPNAVVLALQGLERRMLAVGHADAPPTWSPTLTGRNRARFVRAAEPRTRPSRG